VVAVVAVMPVMAVMAVMAVIFFSRSPNRWTQFAHSRRLHASGYCMVSTNQHMFLFQALRAVLSSDVRRHRTLDWRNQLEVSARRIS